MHTLELRCHSGVLGSSDKHVPEALHAVPKTAPMLSHAPPCYILNHSPSAQELMGARWKVMRPHMLSYHPTASHNAPSSSRVCRSHGPWADMGWHGCCMVRYGRPWACMGPHGSSDGNSPFSGRNIPRSAITNLVELFLRVQGSPDIISVIYRDKDFGRVQSLRPCLEPQ